jgi:CRP/FNR family cyclic AMP-dependent transcriptional regulator
MQPLETALEKAELLEGLAARHRATLAACAHEEQYGEDALLARWGDVADAFWLIREGRVALELGVPGRGEVTIALAGPGDMIGFSWLCAPYVMHFDVRAISNVAATRFDAAALRGRFASDPVLGYELATRFARLAVARVEAANLQLLDVYGEHPIENT